MEILEISRLENELKIVLDRICQQYNFEYSEILQKNSEYLRIIIFKGNIEFKAFYHIREGLTFSFENRETGNSTWTVGGIFFKRFGFMSKELAEFNKSNHEIATKNSNNPYEYQRVIIELDISYLEQNYKELLVEGKVPTILND